MAPPSSYAGPIAATKNAPLTVVVQDSLPLVRVGFRSLLADRASGASFADAIADPAGLPDLCRSARADVALFELQPATGDLIAACRAARPGIRLIALHLGRQTDHAGTAEALGVTLLSYAAPAPVALATIIGQGHRAATVMAHDRRLHKRSLLPVEREILRLAGEGLTCRETAERLGLDSHEVEDMTAAVLELLGTSTLTGAIRLGRETGLVPRLRQAG